MPELPEVETTRRGLEPHLQGCRIESVEVREPRLRWPIPAEVRLAEGQVVRGVERRGKYLLLDCGVGRLLIHLGMSGSLRLLETTSPAQKHEHFDLRLEHGRCLRYRDPRRFGCLLWVAGATGQHPLLRELGPEPLEAEFSGAYLHRLAQGRHSAVKSFIMDSHVVVGVGNIYASESLALAGIHPGRAAGQVSLARYRRLAAAIREVLTAAIAQGGTTLRDFTDGAGRPGYFQQELRVYGRAGENCRHCGGIIQHSVLGQRATYHCPTCQH